MITEGRMLGAARKGVCPGCGTPGMIPGPMGGASRNYYCGQCGQGWNLHGIGYGIIGLESIGRTDPKAFALWKSIHDKLQAQRDMLKQNGMSDQDIDELFRFTDQDKSRP